MPKSDAEPHLPHRAHPREVFPPTIEWTDLGCHLFDVPITIDQYEQIEEFWGYDCTIRILVEGGAKLRVYAVRKR